MKNHKHLIEVVERNVFLVKQDDKPNKKELEKTINFYLDQCNLRGWTPDKQKLAEWTA